MTKLPYMQLYTGDWLKDPNLSMCSPATRGIWMDMLCAMHEKERCGELTGRIDQLARLARCSTDELNIALTELNDTDTATVTFSNGIVTVSNRRMKRELKFRELTRVRVRKFRNKKQDGNADVTDKKRNLSEDEDEYEIDNDIDTEEKGERGENKNPILGELIGIAKEFHEFQHKKNPNLLRLVNDKLNETGALELDKLMRLDKYDIKTIKQVLEYVKQDDRPGFNWNRNLLSLASIRQKGKNGNTKFVNILASMDGKIKPPQNNDKKNKPKDTWLIHPDWSLCHIENHPCELYYDPNVNINFLSSYPDVQVRNIAIAYCKICDKQFDVRPDNLPATIRATWNKIIKLNKKKGFGV